MEFIDFGALIPVVAILSSLGFGFIWLRYHELKVTSRQMELDAGKQAADSVPWKFDPANSALRTGLILIWAGNAANLVLAVVLLWRLQRR